MGFLSEVLPNWPMAITAIGDGAVMLPLAVVLLIAVLDADRGGAVLWAALMVTVLSIVAVVKLAYYAGLGGLANASGHTALSALVLGGLARFAPIFLTGKGLVALFRTACLILMLGIATSRVILGYHSVLDVVSGLALAAVGLAILFRRPLTIQSRRSPAVLILALLILPLTYGNVSGADTRLVELAQELALHLGWPPPPLSAAVPAK
jgi:membrane-associated phospholipid phosphatase